MPPNAENASSFLPLLVVIFLAFLVPLVFARFRRFRIPIVVGEILAGMVVGRSGLNLVPYQDELLTLLAGFGFVFLMFLSGMEIDFSALGGNQKGEQAQDSKRSPLALAGISFALTLVLSLLIGLGLTLVGLVKNLFMMALILSTTSLGVVVPVLKESGLTGGRYGQAILLAALIADFATMLLITVLVAALSRGFTVDLLFIGVLFLVFLFMFRFGFLLNRVPGVRRAVEELAQATTQIKVRAAFTIMMIFVVLSEVVGTEIILGAFLAGAILALIRTRDDAELFHKLEAIGFGFFIPIFFIKVGINFNLAAIFQSAQAILLVPLLLLAAIFVKVIPTLVFKFNFSTQQSLAAGALLAARLSLIIAASEIGRELGIITEAVNAAVVLVAVTTVTLAPIVFLRLNPSRAAGRERVMVVVGLGDLGMRVAEELKAHYEHVIALDNTKANVQRALARGIQARHAIAEAGDAVAAQVLDQASAVVCTYGDSELNYRVCQLARQTYGIGHVVAHVTNPADLPRFEELGVVATNAAFDRAAMLVMLTRNPSTYQLLTRTDDDKEVTEVPVHNMNYVGRTLRQLTLPGDVLILAVRREGELLVPHGNTRLNYGDSLTLVGTLDSVNTARNFIANGYGAAPSADA